MPTPVSNARACLATEAVSALDDAVVVARRRAHAQTTSLHVVYALLISSSSSAATGKGGGGGSTASCSILRDALARARSSAYPPRLQFKALELCFGAALDRLPSASTTTNRQAEEGARAGDEPPVSNSLMAAIKRSQANQRRNPDTFHLYQQQQQQSAASASAFSGVKVELQQLVLAILDDPVVSRVFGDAGFRSTDIKFAILRPPPSILRFPRAARCPPLFLCNFSDGDGFEATLTPRGLVFPFAAAAAAAQLCSDGSEENCRRIGEILARKSSGRNPMLIGVGAGDAARDFAVAVERQNWAFFPPELRGTKFVSIEKEVAKLGTGRSVLSEVGTLLEELEKQAESSGVVLNLGDLKGMVEGSAECDEQESCLVSELTRLLEVCHGRLRLMGWSATYETYMKFLSKHPMLDKDWDLQLLPITSVRTSMSGSVPRSPSLMESFVPFGRLLSTVYEPKSLFSSVYSPVFRYEHCSDKYEQEAVPIIDRSASVDDPKIGNIPCWMHKASIVSLNDEHKVPKAKDEKTMSNSDVMSMQKKWTENGQSPHSECQTTNVDYCSPVPSVNLSCISSMEKASNQNKENPDDAQNQRGFQASFSISVGTDRISMGKVNKSISMPSLLEVGNKDLLSKLQVRLSNSESIQREGFHSLQVDGHASPSSVTSVVTDLVLGTPREPSCSDENQTLHLHKDHVKEFPGCLPSTMTDRGKGNGSDVPVESFSCSSHQDSQAKTTNPLVLTHSFLEISNGCASPYAKPSLISSGFWQKSDLSNYKSFCTSLINKVGRQTAAASAIGQAIIHCKTGERRRGAVLRGDIWLAFHGPDKIGKERMAIALSEIIYGSKENCVCIDLSYEDSIARPSTICANQVGNGNGIQFRGKMNVDYIAEELSRKPQSVIFLENVDKADLLVQNSLSQAIRTGKFPDSHGREFSVNNAIFILTSSATQGHTFIEKKDYTSFSEETILAACCWQMRILFETSRDAICSPKANKISFSSSPKARPCQINLNSVFLSKRKLDVSDDYRNLHQSLVSEIRAYKTVKVNFDLNLPVEEPNGDDNNYASHDDSSKVENLEAWMEDFHELVDALVDFVPFDFDALANSLLQDVSKIFHGVFGSSDCLLVIDPKVMEEILAVAWSLEDRKALNNWFEHVLGGSFIEASRRYNLSNHSILRLIACEDEIAVKHAPEVLLPSKIILNQ